MKIIQNVVKKYYFNDYISLSKKIYDTIFEVFGEYMQYKSFCEVYRKYRWSINLIYIGEEYKLLTDLDERNTQNDNNHIIKDINNQFYLGFGYDIYHPDE